MALSELVRSLISPQRSEIKGVAQQGISFGWLGAVERGVCLHKSSRA